MTRRRGRRLVKDRDLGHPTLPTDPEELTPAERAWVRLVWKALKRDRRYIPAHLNGGSTIFANGLMGAKGLPEPWFKP